jgi:hypothetical protein
MTLLELVNVLQDITVAQMEGVNVKPQPVSMVVQQIVMAHVHAFLDSVVLIALELNAQ